MMQMRRTQESLGRSNDPWPEKWEAVARSISEYGIQLDFVLGEFADTQKSRLPT
jgi:hypothetical protein